VHPLKGIPNTNHHKSTVKIKEIAKNEKKLKKKKNTHLLFVVGQHVYIRN
jgi:hypothetical protein